MVRLEVMTVSEWLRHSEPNPPMNKPTHSSPESKFNFKMPSRSQLASQHSRILLSQTNKDSRSSRELICHLKVDSRDREFHQHLRKLPSHSERRISRSCRPTTSGLSSPIKFPSLNKRLGFLSHKFTHQTSSATLRHFRPTPTSETVSSIYSLSPIMKLVS